MVTDTGSFPEVPFEPSLRDRLASNLARHEVRTHELDGRRHAAVAVIVVDSDAEEHGTDPSDVDRIGQLSGVPGIDEMPHLDGRVDGTAGGAALLLTRRGRNLAAHARQWALPGGRVDPGETPLEAAMREAQEEVGLDLDESHLLGRLDDYPTRSGYVMSPFVFWVEDIEPVANPDEVASIHRIGIHVLRAEPRFVAIPESDRPVIQVPIGGDLMHAPTGAVVHQFRAVAYDGTATRVDEYEQPVFAWR